MNLLHKLVELKVPAVVTACFAMLSVYLGFKVYRRKSGAYIRGSFTPSASRDCNDEFVSQVKLENLKDRSVTIFGIYLRIGYNIYLEIEDHSDAPLTLKPFETYGKSFGPIEFYTCNMSKVSINGLLFGNRNVKKHLFLSTSDGKYKVRSPIWSWEPISDSLLNYFTAVLQPIRSMHRDGSIGGNVKFVIDLVKADGNIETVRLRPDDYRLKIFKDFSLTMESLESKEALEQFLHQKKEEGTIACNEIVVYDLPSWRVRTHESYKGETTQVKPQGLFQYYVIGRAVSMFEDRRVRRNNVQLAKARQQQQQIQTTVPPQKESAETLPKEDDIVATVHPTVPHVPHVPMTPLQPAEPAQQPAQSAQSEKK